MLSLEEVEQYLETLEKNNLSTVKLQSLGKSTGGRNIWAVSITDSDISLSDKEVALIMGLRHGNEVGVIPAVIKMLDWLVSEEGKPTRQKQNVIVIPVVNPDGFIKKEFGAPRDRISDDEKSIIVPFILKQQADMVLDIHSLSRGDLEAVITGHTLHMGEDDYIQGLTAGKMIAGAAEAGYPYVLHMLGVQSLKPWLSTPRISDYEVSVYNNWVCAPIYEELHSLVIGMEVNSYSLNEEECGKSGLAAIRPLFELGNTRSPWEYASGYPNRIIKGNMHVSLRAAGQTAEERRRSRVEIWQRRDNFTSPIRILPSMNQIKAKIKYSGEPLVYPFSICCRLRGRPEIQKVTLNERVHNYYEVRDNCSTFIFVDFASAQDGLCEISIDL